QGAALVIGRLAGEEEEVADLDRLRVGAAGRRRRIAGDRLAWVGSCHRFLLVGHRRRSIGQRSIESCGPTTAKSSASATARGCWWGRTPTRSPTAGTVPAGTVPMPCSSERRSRRAPSIPRTRPYPSAPVTVTKLSALAPASTTKRSGVGRLITVAST